MTIITYILGASLGISWLYYLFCLESARAWAARKRDDVESRQADIRQAQSAAGRRQPAAAPDSSRPLSSPGVTILKPLRGADPEQLENFRSFCRQDYPEFQIVFGALDPDDQGLESARLLREEFPDRDISIVAGGEAFGANLKVCNLANMIAAASHPVIVLCDSDMRVGADYLASITAPFADPDVGVVTCPYRGAQARGLASTLEALGIGADFIPSVILTARFGRIRFALGSTIAIRREVLDQIGGFRPLADELADDYLIGNLAARAGWRVVLSTYVVDDVIGRQSFREMWSRRVRWARTTRAMQPVPVLFSYLTHGTALALMLLVATGFAMAGWIALAITVALRMTTATSIARFYTRDENLPKSLALLPFSDLVSFGIWAAGFLGSSVEWRGERFRVGWGGKLRKV